MPLLRNITAVFLLRLALSNYITRAFKSKKIKKTCEGNHRDYQRRENLFTDCFKLPAKGVLWKSV